MFNSNIVATIAAVLIIALAVYFGMSVNDGGFFGFGGDSIVVDGGDFEDVLNYPSPFPTGPVDIPIDKQPYLGQEDAPVVMVEFVDYECPYCQAFAERIIEPMKSEYIDTGKVRLVMKDFPLASHTKARSAAIASNCAFVQGGNTAYFGFHDRLFADTSSWISALDADKVFRIYAEEIGLNLDEFNECLESGEVMDGIDQDRADGEAIGVSGTPVFFINNMPYLGLPPTFGDMKEILDEALEN